jgi:hypothetical protein
MKVNKRNDELVTSEVKMGKGFISGLNIEFTNKGMIKRRKGYNTFGEMVDVLWDINKRMKKNRFTQPITYTIILPLKGTKPIYKKTLRTK